MTAQIDLILQNIAECDDYEDDEVFVRTYINRLEQRIKELEESKSCTGCVYDKGIKCNNDNWCSRNAVDMYQDTKGIENV